mgnify:FL=1
MKVKLIGYTQSHTDVETGGNLKELIAFCARVSNPSNQNNNLTSDRLIKYLIQHKHWSPFEMCSATLEIETTRDIARQLLRHRSFSFQEFSQRYADPTQDLGMETREARLQDLKNRQNSIELDVSSNLNTEWQQKQQDLITYVQEMYNWAISNGIAKEQARAILPEGLTKSRLYVNGTIRSWIHYIEVRTTEGTQKEHIELAYEIAKVISSIFPYNIIG